MRCSRITGQMRQPHGATVTSPASSCTACRTSVPHIGHGVPHSSSTATGTDSEGVFIPARLEPASDSSPDLSASGVTRHWPRIGAARPARQVRRTRRRGHRNLAAARYHGRQMCAVYEGVICGQPAARLHYPRELRQSGSQGAAPDCPAALILRYPGRSSCPACRRNGRCCGSSAGKRRPEPHGHRSLRPSFSTSPVSRPIVRSPRLTRDSLEGTPGGVC
jgi:hypothetical protein